MVYVFSTSKYSLNLYLLAFWLAMYVYTAKHMMIIISIFNSILYGKQAWKQIIAWNYKIKNRKVYKR